MLILLKWIRKRRYEIQDCEDFQPCRKFIAEELAVHLIINKKTVKAGELKVKLSFKQLDLIITKQKAIDLRIRKLFSKEDIMEDFSALNYLIDFYFPKCKLAIEVDELSHKDRDQTIENKRQKDLKEYLDCKFIRIKPDKEDEIKKILTFIDEFKKKENEKSLIDHLLKKTIKIKI